VNVADRIRLGFDRFNRRDWEAIARGLPEHFEAVDHLDEQSARGPHAFREITTANGDLAFADLQMEPTEIVPLSAQGERVIVVVRILATASGGTSGVPVDSELAQIWAFESGVPVRFEQFRTWDEALAAAGRE
jgi:SnoaL-like domain